MKIRYAISLWSIRSTGIRATHVTRRLAISILCALCAFVVNLPAQAFRAVTDGIEHAEVIREASGKQIKINLLRLDLTKVRLDVVHAMDAAIGTEKASSIAMRHGAVAAINAGFFRLDTSIFAGDAAGLLMIDRQILSDPRNDQIVAGFSNGRWATQVEFGRSDVSHVLHFGRKTLAVSGINRELLKDELVLYKPSFHSTTMTTGPVFEVVVRRGRVRQVVTDKGSTAIPQDGFVLSASGKRIVELKELARKGAKAVIGLRYTMSRISHQPDSPPVETFEDAVAGIPQLIKDGKIDITWEQERSSKAFVETRHPRTAIAKLKDGKFLMITVDGRSEVSAGIDLHDLAAYLLELGATDAMNLDGGGSTTMFLDGKVVNQPSDKEGERKVSDAILVRRRGP